MGYYTNEFRIEFLTQCNSIVLNPIQAYVQLPRNTFLLSSQIKRDDVRVVVVIQELKVHHQQFFVRNENDVQILYQTAMMSGQLVQPKRNSSIRDEIRAFYVLEVN